MKTYSHDLYFKDLKIQIYFSNRKTIELSLINHKAQITAPLKTPENKILKFIEEKWLWIQKHLYTSTFNKQAIFQEGCFVWYLGKRYPLAWVKSPKTWIEIKDSQLLISSPSSLTSQQFEEIINQWYFFRAKEILPHLVKNWQEILIPLGFPTPQKLHIGTQKTKWGSLNTRGTMSLNSHLVLLNLQQINYVIAHEFCHFKQMNHSPKFYEELSKIFPNWKQVRQEIKQISLTPLPPQNQQ